MLRSSLIILAFAIILPLLIFIGVELSTLSEDEQILQDIYEQQIDAVLFSVNQYSEDFVRSFYNELVAEWTHSDGTSLLSEGLKSVNLALIGASVKDDQITTELFVENQLTERLLKRLDSTYRANESTIERLKSYKEANYTKLEPIGSVELETGRSAYLILSVTNADVPMIIMLDAQLFAEDLLMPRLQQIAGKNLVISIHQSTSDQQVVSTDSLSIAVIRQADLWLLPDFHVKVSKKGESLDELLAYRRSRNQLALLLLSSLLLLGVFLIYRVMRKEAQASKAKSDFVANVSHEIRTPLSLISMLNETLMTGRITDESKKKEYYRTIDLEIRRLSNIVGKILSFSRMDAGKRHYEFVPLHADDEIRRVFNDFQKQLEQDGFEFDLNLGTSDAMIHADKEALEEAFINLLDNAMKYSVDKKYIQVQSQRQDAYYVLMVTDHGVGIPTDQAAFIFDKFYRVKGDKHYSVRGTGLGLALVSNIMQAHRGRVEVTSEPEKGSTFRLYFPILNHG